MQSTLLKMQTVSLSECGLVKSALRAADPLHRLESPALGAERHSDSCVTQTLAWIEPRLLRGELDVKAKEKGDIEREGEVKGRVWKGKMVSTNYM